MGYQQPLRYIFDIHDHQAFTRSAAHDDLLRFVAAVNTAVTDKSNRADCAESDVVKSLLSLLSTLSGWIEEIPPATQAMRYGNKAFRTWNARLLREAPSLCRALLDHKQSLAGAEVELAPYLCESFGNATRIDYGTGHETTYVVFLYCLCKLGLCGPDDLPALGLRVFPAYLDVARKLQRTYWLEPAGSHGVWSLDDYQFLVFLFGSAQLANHPRIKPRSIHSAEVLEGFARDYMYLSAVGFISSVKFGAPFAEHSPILNDISELPSWSKVNEGLAKMYRGEVLGKLPVVQHFLFGSLFKADWTPSRHPCPPEAGAAHVLLSGEISDVPSSPEVPMDEPERAVAPWVTEPISLSGRFPRSPSSPGSSSAGSGGAFDPNITGMAPWARQTGRSPGASGSDRPSPHAHLAGATPGASIEGGSPGGQGPSTVTTFLEAFGPIPHVTPKQAEAAAAAAAAAAEEGQEGAGAGNGQATSEKSGPNTVSS